MGSVGFPAGPMDGGDRVGYLFGHPIAHSLSPLLHSTVFKGLGLNWEYHPLDSTDMGLFLELIKHPNFYGSAVTMPHKVTILPHLDDLTPEGRDVGAINTLFHRPGPNNTRLYIGTNTDVVGIRDAFAFNIASPTQVYENRPALVVGGGGAARSAVYALTKWMKATAVYVVNRDKAEVDAVIAECAARGFGANVVHVATVEQAAALPGVGAIVACVPNFPPVTEAEVTARAVLETFLQKEHKGAVLEMCYHPSPWTEIAEISEREGWRVVLGTEAMIYQGLEQHKYWSGKETWELPVEEVKRAVAGALGKEGVVKRTS